MCQYAVNWCDKQRFFAFIIIKAAEEQKKLYQHWIQFTAQTDCNTLFIRQYIFPPETNCCKENHKLPANDWNQWTV